MDERYVQYGCGLDAPMQWLNFDASPTLRLQKIPFIGYFFRAKVPFPKNVYYGDITKGLPLKKGSAEAIYCSHVLEHLSHSDFKIALKNTHSLLKPNGVFRLVVPDLERLIADYRASNSKLAADVFNKGSGMGVERRTRSFIGFIKEYMGNSHHLWIWDFSSIEYYLEQAGFVSIRRAEYGDSKLGFFSYVENEQRWKNAVGIECYK